MTDPARRAWRSASVRWASGPWAASLVDSDASDGAIDNLEYRGQLVLRSIRVAIRDRDWNSRALRISRSDASNRDDQLLELDVSTADQDAALSGQLRIFVDGPRLSVHLVLHAEADVMTNRAGLVVLCPAELGGTALRVSHPDGTVDESEFPSQIAPHETARAIRSLDWTSDGTTVALTFSGDVFEMEDQRNWTDASFKIYNRPLPLPFPFLVRRGETIRQSVELTAQRDADPVTRSAARRTVVAVDAAGVFPEIAVGAATVPGTAPPRLPGWIGTVLVELDLATQNWRAALARARHAGGALDVRFILSDTDKGTLADAVTALRGLDVVRVTAFWPTGPSRHVSDAAAIAALRAELARARLKIPVVGGARSHFTELNREHLRLPADLAGVVFAVTPLFHDRSTEQLVESLPMQRLVARQAVILADGAPVHIGPVTLRPRFNDVATLPPPRPPDASLDSGYGPQLIDSDDPRQGAPELAAWTLASAAALSVPGVATLTYFEEWGARGISSRDGAALPVADILHRLAAFSGSPRLAGASADHLVWAIGIVQEGRETLLVANLDVRDRDIELRSPDALTLVRVSAGDWMFVC